MNAQRTMRRWGKEAMGRRLSSPVLGLLLVLAMICPGGNTMRADNPQLAPEEVLTRMERQLEQRQKTLESYQARRRYSVTHSLLGKPAYLVVEERYRAPGEKTFRVIERGGRPEVQERVFSRLLEAEQETARGSIRRQVELCRRNYDFTFRGYDAANSAYVFGVEPRGSSPYLLRGTVWVDSQDFAVKRIEGEPVRRQSSLVRQTRFVHEFAKFGDFWFPVRNHSESDLLMLGRAVLEITYFDYQWQSYKEEQL